MSKEDGKLRLCIPETGATKVGYAVLMTRPLMLLCFLRKKNPKDSVTRLIEIAKSEGVIAGRMEISLPSISG